MENRDCNQEVGKRINTKQNTDTYNARGDIGDRSSNLIKLIGAERVSRRDFKYEGTYYVTKDGEVYDKEHAIAQKVQRTPIKVETIEQYREYVTAVKYWQSIKKYDGKRKK